MISSSELLTPHLLAVSLCVWNTGGTSGGSWRGPGKSRGVPSCSGGWWEAEGGERGERGERGEGT